MRFMTKSVLYIHKEVTSFEVAKEKPDSRKSSKTISMNLRSESSMCLFILRDVTRLISFALISYDNGSHKKGLAQI